MVYLLPKHQNILDATVSSSSASTRSVVDCNQKGMISNYLKVESAEVASKSHAWLISELLCVAFSAQNQEHSCRS